MIRQPAVDCMVSSLEVCDVRVGHSLRRGGTTEKLVYRVPFDQVIRTSPVVRWVWRVTQCLIVGAVVFLFWGVIMLKRQTTELEARMGVTIYERAWDN